MGSFGLYGIQNVSFIDLETGKKINMTDKIQFSNYC